MRVRMRAYAAVQGIDENGVLLLTFKDPVGTDSRHVAQGGMAPLGPGPQNRRQVGQSLPPEKRPSTYMEK